MSRIANLVRWAALSLALAAAPCFADQIVERNSSPALNVVSLPDKQLSTDQVRGAIISGGAVHAWTLKSEAAGSLVLKLDKGKYYAEIRLRYSTDGYSIEYLTSSNLKYRREAPGPASNVSPTPGVEVTPNYTDLVDGLIRAIDASISGIQSVQ